MTSQRRRALILLVDDSLTQARRAAQALETAGFRVQLASNGREALEKTHRWRPDAIVSDILMPIMDGFALCREVRRDPTLGRVPIVLHTLTYVDPKDEEFALALGATRFVLKPTDPVELVEEIRGALATGHVRDQAALTVDNEAFLQGYSERLAAKLEDKVTELEAANQWLEQQHQETAAARDRLALLLESSQLAASSLDVNVLLGRVAERIVTALGVTFCRISLVDPSADRLIVQASYPIRVLERDPAVGQFLALADAPIHRSVLTAGEPRVVRLDSEASMMSLAERTAAWLDETQTALLLPMGRGDEPVGLLQIGEERSWQRGPITPEQVELVRAMAAQVMVAVENAHLHRAQIQAEREMRLLAEVGALFSSPVDRGGAPRRVLEKATETLAEGCALWLTEPGGGPPSLTVHCQDPALQTLIEEHPSAGAATAWLSAAQLPEPLVLMDALTDRVRLTPDQRRFLGEAGLRSVLAVPLTGPRGGLGTFVLFDRRPGHFTAGLLSFARRLAERVALAMEERRLHEALIEARSAVEAQREIDRLKNELIAVVSHDLRTPMTSVIGFAEMLLTSELPEAWQRECVTIMHQEGQRLTALVDDFLDLQRIQDGRYATCPVPTELGRVLKDAVAAAGDDPERPIHLDVPDGLPRIMADADRIRQVISNLLSNARKYSPGGGTVELSARQVEDAVEVAVRDQGLGIPAEALPRLFETFYRVDSSDRRSISGTGLGLAIVKQIVEAHGGRVWAESAGLGQGACFRFTLPLIEDDALTAPGAVGERAS